jgi:uncharacterized RDD family membrane protein YckC
MNNTNQNDKNHKLESSLFNKEITLASIEKRFLAHLIDETLLSIIVIFVISDNLTENSIEEIIIFLNSLFIEFIIMKLIYQTLFVSLYGGTIGKIVMKIKVIDSINIYNVSIYQAFIRAIIRIFSESLFYLGYLWGYLAPYKQTWHDKGAKTIVINVK